MKSEYRLSLVLDASEVQALRRAGDSYYFGNVLLDEIIDAAMKQGSTSGVGEVLDEGLEVILDKRLAASIIDAIDHDSDTTKGIHSILNTSLAKELYKVCSEFLDYVDQKYIASLDLKSIE